MLLWSPSSDALAHLEQVFAQLRLEHFQTGERVRLTVGRRAQAIVAYASLAPGPYQLVQLRKNGQRHCLPLWCVDGWVTSVYLLVLSDQVTAKPLPVELDHASMTLLRPGLRVKDVEGSLRRLEGARKALGLGRRISGWSTWQDSDSRVENPMLELMDALLSGSREIFCNNLSMPYCDGFSSASSEAGGGRTLGPPLLRQHWDLLLQSDGAERQLQALFHQPFTVEAKGVWFTWTELSHAAKFEDVSRFVLSQLAVQMAAEQVRAPRHTGPRFVKLKLRRLSGQSLEETIAAFFQSQTFKRAWAGSRKVAEGKRLHLTDPRLSKLFAALLVLTDQTLIQSIGAIELVRQALQGLRLPATQVNQLGWLLLQELLAWMGTESLAPVAVQPALPAAQLKLATKQVQQQKVALAPLLAAASKPFGDS
ncbi:hypothetical protein DMX06_19800 [Pseudomonas mosselii]|nr:hypothetical protein DMX06_19800 [Pseudomonas mosselii]